VCVVCVCVRVCVCVCVLDYFSSLNNVINYIGEGCKPIFDREELKKVINKTNEIEERRTVVAIDKEQSGMYYTNNCYLLLVFTLKNLPIEELSNEVI